MLALLLLSGCAHVDVHPRGVAAAALNVALGEADDYAFRGSFRKVREPALDAFGVRVDSAGRISWVPSDDEGPRGMPTRRRVEQRFTVNATGRKVYFQVEFKF